MVEPKRRETRANNNATPPGTGPRPEEEADPHPSDRATRPDPHIPPPGIDPAQAEMPPEAPMDNAGRIGISPEDKGFPIGFWIGGLAMVAAGLLLIYVLV